MLSTGNSERYEIVRQIQPIFKESRARTLRFLFCKKSNHLKRNRNFTITDDCMEGNNWLSALHWIFSDLYINLFYGGGGSLAAAVTHFLCSL